MSKILSLALLFLTLCSLLTVGVSASYEYNFAGVEDTDFLPATDYEHIYGAQYNYGGPNVIDFNVPELSYGQFSTTQTGVMEQAMLPGLQESVLGYGVTNLASGDYGIGVVTDGAGVVTVESGPADFFPTVASTVQVKTNSFTQYNDSFLLANGAVGSISIPALGIKNMYAWQGETNASMAKGLGHFVSTSVWDGNVAFCGHNRGAAYVIGGIKDMHPGDTLTYTTSMGTRTYVVQTVTTIPSDDWTYMQSTSDNRITLITCVAGDYSQRWMLQAVEVA